MIRKLFVGLGLITLGSYLWFGTQTGSYVRTAYAQVKGFVLGQVPVEFEIERARNMVVSLKPEIEKARRAIVGEEIKLDRLRRDIAKSEENLQGEKVAILKLREELGKKLTSYKIGGSVYSSHAIEKDLGRRFASYQHAEEILKSKREILTSRETALLAAREKHDRLYDAKGQLESKLAALEARMKMLEVKKMSSHLIFDDSQLADVQKLMEDIGDRLDVDAKVAEEDGVLEKTIPASGIPSVDLGQQIDAHFGVAVQKTGSAL